MGLGDLSIDISWQSQINDTIDLEALPYRMLIISNYLPITVYRVEDQNSYFRYITGYITGFRNNQ